MAKAKINTLCKHIGITDTNKATVLKALENKKVLDLEDGLEYYSALGGDCKFIITEDLKDFYFSDIEVLDSRSFFERHIKEYNG